MSTSANCATILKSDEESSICSSEDSSVDVPRKKKHKTTRRTTSNKFSSSITKEGQNDNGKIRAKFSFVSSVFDYKTSSILPTIVINGLITFAVNEVNTSDDGVATHGSVEVVETELPGIVDVDKIEDEC